MRGITLLGVLLLSCISAYGQERSAFYKSEMKFWAHESDILDMHLGSTDASELERVSDEMAKSLDASDGT